MYNFGGMVNIRQARAKKAAGAEWALSPQERRKTVQWYLDNGVFTLDPEGRIWRVKERAKRGELNAAYLKPIPPKLADTRLTRNGYRRVQFNYAWRTFTIMAHRVVLSLVGGELIPDNVVVDHRNGVRFDNRPQNLAAVHYLENNDRMVWTKIMGFKLGETAEAERTAYLLRRAFYDTGVKLVDVAHRFGVPLGVAKRIVDNEIFPDEETPIIPALLS